MPITTEDFHTSLYDLLRTKGYQPIPLDSKGKTSPFYPEADIFKFSFVKDGKKYGDVWATVDNGLKLVLYYDDEVSSSPTSDTKGVEVGDSWPALLKHLKRWAQRRQLGFELKNKDHLVSDMQQREYMKKKERLGEGYYPMGKKASYNDAIPQVKIVIQHTKQIGEGEQRFRNVDRIFVENTEGERFAVPTKKPGLAKVYARHVAEGGTPYDDRGRHLTTLIEEYNKMVGFVRATKSGEFNESVQRVVNAGIDHYQSLRESLGKLTSHRGYHSYFDSWSPVLNEEQSDLSEISTLFTKSNLDPRIESCIPILSKLTKLDEIKPVKELDSWADEVIRETTSIDLSKEGPTSLMPGAGKNTRTSREKDRAREKALSHYSKELAAHHYGNELNKSDQGVAEGNEQKFMIYFVVPSYDDHHETEERTIIVANDRTEAIKKFKEQLPGAYINDIYPVNNQGVAEGSSDPTRKVFFKVKNTLGTGMPSGYHRVKKMIPLEDGGFYIELSKPGYGMDYTRHNYKNFSLKDDRGWPITGQEANNIINGKQGMAEGWEADANKLGYKIKSSPDGQHAYRHDSDKVSHVGTNNKNISWLYHPDESGKSIKKDYKQGVAEGEVVEFSLPKAIQNLALEWVEYTFLEDGPEQKRIEKELSKKGFDIDFSDDGDALLLTHSKTGKEFLVQIPEKMQELAEGWDEDSYIERRRARKYGYDTGLEREYRDLEDHERAMAARAAKEKEKTSSKDDKDQGDQIDEGIMDFLKKVGLATAVIGTLGLPGAIEMHFLNKTPLVQEIKRRAEQGDEQAKIDLDNLSVTLGSGRTGPTMVLLNRYGFKSVQEPKSQEGETYEGLNAQQKKARQLGPTEKAENISPVLGSPQHKHPFDGKLVGNESADPDLKRLQALIKHIR